MRQSCVRYRAARSRQKATTGDSAPWNVEEARKKNALLPAELLHLIIRYGENVLQEFFNKYLQQIITNYLEFKKAMDEQFSKWLDMGIDYSDMAQKTLTGLTPFNSFFNQFARKPGEPDKKEDK